MTGRGAGLSDEGLERKIAVIRRAIEVNAPDPRDPLDVLSKVGGLISPVWRAFIWGPPSTMCLWYWTAPFRRGRPAGCAALPGRGQGPHRQPQVSGALQRPAPDALGCAPIVSADLKLGRGTGAVTIMPMLDMAMSIYRDMATFQGLGIPPYRRQS